MTETEKNHTNSLRSEHKKNKEQIDNKKVKIKKKMRYLKSSPELNWFEITPPLLLSHGQ